MPRRHLTQLFLAHRRELQRYLTERLHDRELAADLMQETFLRFAEQSSGPAIAHDRAYLYRTAHNLVVDHARRAARHGTEVRPHGELTQFPEDTPGAEVTVDARRRLLRLHAAIEELPERTRRVFVLHRIEELSYREVAARLGISESSVQKHLAKALRHVMRRVAPG